MTGFHIDAKTAYKVVNELGFKANRFTAPPLQDHTVIYGINFTLKQVFAITRAKKPRRKLTFDQVCELVLVPVEAHQEWLKAL